MAASKLRPGIRVDEFLPIDDPDDQGTYDTFWGRAWVHIKLHDPTKPLMLANELIGGRLAAALGLPTLPGETALNPDGVACWVTPRVTTPAGGTPPPPTATAINASHPTVVAGMVAFDAWIHNIDRTEDNVLFDPRLGLWLIDHENAFAEPDGRAFSTSADHAARQRLSSHGFGRVPIDADALRFWVQRIEMVSNHTIERPIAEANHRGLINQIQAKWLTRYLLARRDRLATLMPSTNADTGTLIFVGGNENDVQESLFEDREA